MALTASDWYHLLNRNSMSVVRPLSKMMILLTFLRIVLVAVLNRCLPHFQTACLHMPSLSAAQTLDDVLARTFASLVTNLVALEAQLGIAVETLVPV